MHAKNVSNRRLLLSLLAATATWAGSLGTPAEAASATIPAVRNVMTGNSSSGNDQVWFRVNGTPPGIPANCTLNGFSIFYLATDGKLDGQKGMALLLSAQMSRQPVQIDFDVAASSSDFWGWGVTNCKVNRIVIGD